MPARIKLSGIAVDTQSMRERSPRRVRRLLRRCGGALRGRREAELLARLGQGIDRSALETARKELEPHAPSPEGAIKYFDVDHYLGVNLRRALALGLHRSRPLRVLDLGCGFGYFLYTCGRFGHDALGLDFADGNFPFAARCYERSVGILRQRRVLHRIEPFGALPDLGGPFDLVTAFQICFDAHASENRWGGAEWRHFLGDLRGHLAPDARVHLELNAAPDGDVFSPELRSTLLSLGARIRNHVVRFDRAARLPLGRRRATRSASTRRP